MTPIDLHDLLYISTIAASVSAGAWVVALWVTLRRRRDV